MSSDAHIGWSIVWHSEVSTWRVDSSNIDSWTTAANADILKRVICLYVQTNDNIFRPKYFRTNTNPRRIQI